MAVAKEVVVLLFVCGLYLLGGCQGLGVSAAFYNSHALIGTYPIAGDQTKFYFTVLLVKDDESPNTEESSNRTISRSAAAHTPVGSGEKVKDGGDANYVIKTIFHDDKLTGFGESVALGLHFAGTPKETTVAVIGSTGKDGSATVYDVDNCTNTNCDMLYVIVGDDNCKVGALVAAGNNFVAAACGGNLMQRNPVVPLVICNAVPTHAVGLSDETCTPQKVQLKEDFQPCGKGTGDKKWASQLSVTALDAFDNLVAFTFCAVCSEMASNALLVTRNSGYMIMEVMPNGTTVELGVIFSNRTTSCPQSMGVSPNWLVIGYPDEQLADFYASEPGGQYSLIGTTYEDTPGFGSCADADGTTAIVSAEGRATTQEPGAAFIFQLNNLTTTPTYTELVSSIPCNGYPVKYDFTFRTRVFQGEILVITQDPDYAFFGFDIFESCPAGSGWSPDVQMCESCAAGMNKDTIYNYQYSYELCIPCPYGAYSNTSGNCANISCPQGFFCPDGSVVPIRDMRTEYTVVSVPNPIPTAVMDFENTFYYSCYPYFILLLCMLFVLYLAMCISWPCQHSLQHHIVHFCLYLNFYTTSYSWRDGKVGKKVRILDEDEDKEKEKQEVIDEYTPILPSQQTLKQAVKRHKKRLAVIYTRKRKVTAEEIVGSFCSYLFLSGLVLLGVFFMKFINDNDYNRSLEINLQTFDAVDDVKLYYLDILDSSPLVLSLTIEGYTGNCTSDSLDLTLSGCNDVTFRQTCPYHAKTIIANNSCTFEAHFLSGNQLDPVSQFTFRFDQLDFYAQRVVYNISTSNNATTLTHGNSYLSGVLQPYPGTILRGNNTLTVLSMITYITNCTTNSSSWPSYFKEMVRVSKENCIFHPSSYKGMNFLSTSSEPVPSYLYNNLNVSGFSFSFVVQKSYFFRYVTQSSYVTTGAMFTIIMFAVLDVYWIIEVTVPAIVWTIEALNTVAQNLLLFGKTGKKEEKK